MKIRWSLVLPLMLPAAGCVIPPATDKLEELAVAQQVVESAGDSCDRARMVFGPVLADRVYHAGDVSEFAQMRSISTPDAPRWHHAFRITVEYFGDRPRQFESVRLWRKSEPLQILRVLARKSDCSTGQCRHIEQLEFDLASDQTEQSSIHGLPYFLRATDGSESPHFFVPAYIRGQLEGLRRIDAVSKASACQVGTN